MDELNL